MKINEPIRSKILSAAILSALFFAIATPADANVEISPNALNFGNQSVGTPSAPVVLTVKNAGRHKITIISISSSVPQFSYTRPSLPLTLDPGRQLTVAVAFSPVSAQIYKGTLTFLAENRHSITISVSGVGVQTQSLATVRPAREIVMAGQTASFLASFSGSAPLNYQWKRNGEAINGATAVGYTTPPTTLSDNGAQFTVSVSTFSGSVSSSPATLTVIANVVPPSITTQPVSHAVTVGQTATFSAAAAGTAPLSYQWMKNGAAIPGAMSATYTTPATTISDTSSQFTITVTNSAGSITSNPAGLNVTPALVAPSITTQPASQAITEGQPATFYVAATGTAPLSYQWMKTGIPITGATASTYTTPVTTRSLSGSQFTVMARNLAGQVTSNAATLTVNAASVPPVITTQPASQTVTAGQAASFSVIASGTAPLSYLWKKNGTPIPGATSSAYLTPATTGAAISQFTATVSNSAGNVTSNAATLTVNAASVPPVITTQPASQTVTAGQAASFSVIASGTAPLSYQWRKNGTPISGATSSTYTTSVTTTSDIGSQFTTTATNAAGTVTSRAAILTVNGLPGALTASESTLNFGNVNIDASTSQNITFTNSGNANIAISDVIFSGDDGFNISGLFSGLLLSPGQIATLDVRFAPVAAGSVTGQVAIVSNAANSPASISLSGTGRTVPASGASAIPATLFGMEIIYQGDWPTVPFGSHGKGTLNSWPYIEQTKGNFNWNNLDSEVALANSHGLDYFWSYDEAPPWAVTGSTSCSLAADGVSQECTGNVTDLAGFHDFIVALATRYDGNHGHGRIGVYELYHEPESFFTGSISNLVAQTVQMYNDIKTTDPTARITGLGMTFPDTYFASGGYMDQYWAAGGVKTLDAVTFHGYPHHFADVPEIVNTFVPFVTAAMARNGVSSSIPIWDTEGSWGDAKQSGWNPTSDEQLAWVPRSYLLHWSNGVSRFHWYAWGNTTWGALKDATGIHSAGTAYGQVYNWMVGATMSTPCSAKGAVWTCGLTRSGGYQALAVWNTSGTSIYTVVGPYTRIRDVAGNISAITGGSVTIGIKPILLE
jgi:hypothetical protein